MVDSGDGMTMPRVPILVILGATGSGKSRLGIELAQRFSGEVISADSMQVYKGLDIITAKVTAEERLMAPHHMLDEIDPLVNYCVVDFRNKALKIMNDLVARRKMPIIVGGTNYYIESLLWQILVEDPKESGNVGTKTSLNKTRRADVRKNINDNVDFENFDDVSSTTGNDSSDVIAAKRRRPGDNISVDVEKSQVKNSLVASTAMRYDDDAITNEQLHRMLLDVDPEMARRLHPNNRRKVIRSLQVFQDHGITHSDILKTQRLAGGSGLGGPLRYPDSIILWLRCDQKILDQRLDRRVDSMIETGLLAELWDFHARYNAERLKTNTSPDYTKGIFQSIGFKEFHNYLVLPEAERNSEKGKQLLKQAIADLKMVTRRYARKQQRWVTNRFIRRVDRQVPAVYGLDSTNVDEWTSNVLEPAAAIVEAKMKGEKPSQKPLNENVNYEKNSDSSNEEGHWCETCERILIGELQWRAHIGGAKHRRVAHKRRILAEEEPECKSMDPERPSTCAQLGYSSDSNTTSNVLLPPLCDAPLALWPGFFKTIRNLFFVNMVVVPQFDNDFDMKEFITASKHALYVVSQALRREEYDELDGLVTHDVIQSLKRKISTLNDRQKELIGVKQEDIFMTFPYEVGIMYDGEKGHERRFVEITVVHHILRGLARMKDDGELPPPDMAARNDYQGRMSICNYRFIREYTKDVDSPWIINLINHFTPPGLGF